MKNFDGYLKLKLGNDYVLLAGGSHKALSDFSMSGHNHNDLYVSSLTTSGNYLRWIKNGSNNDITIPYATVSSKLVYHSMINYRTDFDSFSGEDAIKVALFQNKGTDNESLVIPFGDGSLISFPWGSDNRYGAQLAIEDTGQTHHLAVRNRNGANSWGAWAMVLTSANYNLYSPKLDGTNASGTWGINISGKASTAGSADNAYTLSSWAGASNESTARYIWMSHDDNSGKAAYWSNFYYVTSTGTCHSTNFSGHLIGSAERLSQSSISSLASFTHSTDLIYTAAGGSNSVGDKPSGVDAFGVFSYKTANGWYGLLLTSSNTGTGLYWRTGTGFSGGWRKVLDSSNYTDYTVTKTGTGASGTWSINISGTADMIKNNITVTGSTSENNGIWFSNGTRTVLFGNGDSGNTGMYIEGKGWIVGMGPSGNVYLNGNATSATSADSAYTVSSWAQVSGTPARYIWMSHSDNLGHAGYDPNVTYHPDTGVLSTYNLSASHYVSAGTYLQAAQNVIVGDSYGLLWNSGGWWLRLINLDTSDTSQWIFKFLQSEGTSGSSWIDYFTIYKNAAYIGSDIVIHAGNYEGYINHLYPKSSWTKRVGYWYTPAVGGKHSSYNSSDTYWISYKYRVKAGDSFLIKGRGGYDPDLYAFTDTSEVVKSISGDGIAWEGGYHTITASYDGYLYVNFNTRYSYGLIPISWTPWYLTEGNYTDYTVTKTGGGASGTWGINITGSASSAYTVSSWAEAGGSEDRYVWMSHSNNLGNAAYKGSLMFNPNAGTLKVTNVSSTGTWYIGNSSGDYVNIGPGYINIRKYSPVNPTANLGTISFDYYGGQTVYIAYTPNDDYRASKGIKIFGDSSDNGNCWLEVQNNVYAANFYTTSDRSKKQNISSFSEHIRKFTLKETNKEAYGVIALEVEEMFRDGEEGNMTVNYNSVLSYYVGLLENKVKDLEEKVRHLENLNK